MKTLCTSCPDFIIHLIWAIVVIFLAFLAFRFLVKKIQFKKYLADTEKKHELTLKEKAFDNDLLWHFQAKLEKDFKKELEDKIKRLESQLKDEQTNRKSKLAEERIKAEHDFYKDIVSKFYTVDKGSTNE